MNYCNGNSASLPGSGWRLPNIGELKSIIGADGFRARRVNYWSSSFSANNSVSASYVNVYTGEVLYNYFMTVSQHVLCVRY